MTIQSITPYLHFFNGSAEQAIALYQRALGAKLEQRKRFDEVPDMKIPPERRGWVMHCELRIDGQLLFLSDSMSSEPVSNCSQVCLSFDDAADMGRKFDALAAGGTVTFPLHDTLWGSKFGMLTDAFGTKWMFNCEQPKP